MKPGNKTKKHTLKILSRSFSPTIHFSPETKDKHYQGHNYKGEQYHNYKGEQ